MSNPRKGERLASTQDAKNRPLLSNDRRKQDMKTLEFIACLYPGCSAKPHFGIHGGRRVYCTAHKKAGMIYIKKTSRSLIKTMEEENASERGTTKKASARDTKKSPRGMNKKACSTKEDIPNYYEEKHHEPAADGMANITTSDTKTLRASVIKVQKMVTKKGINCHTRQKQRKATCSPGVGGKKCSVPLIPAGDGGSGVQPVGKMMTTKDESQDSSSSPAASSPTPLAAVSSQEAECNVSPGRARSPVKSKRTNYMSSEGQQLDH